jgi:hypothetical protein
VGPTRRLFTGLVVGAKDPFQKEVWPDADFVDCGDFAAGGPRQQLIFLDRVNALVATQSHLLDKDFRSLLTKEERQLAEALEALAAVLPPTGHGALRRALEQYTSKTRK